MATIIEYYADATVRTAATLAASDMTFLGGDAAESPLITNYSIVKQAILTGGYIDNVDYAPHATDAGKMYVLTGSSFTTNEGTLITLSSDVTLDIHLDITIVEVETANTAYYLWGGVNSIGTPLFIFTASKTVKPGELITGRRLRGVFLVGSQLEFLPFIWRGGMLYLRQPSLRLPWSNTGSTLPGTLGISQLAVIGDTIYLFGGHNGSAVTNIIYSAPISTPTSWSNTGSTLPGTLGHSQLAVIGDTIYLFGGYNGSAFTNIIYSAPLSHFFAMFDDIEDILYLDVNGGLRPASLTQINKNRHWRLG